MELRLQIACACPCPLLQVYNANDKQQIPLAGVTATQLKSYLTGVELPPRIQELFDQIDECELREKLLMLRLCS